MPKFGFLALERVMDMPRFGTPATWDAKFWHSRMALPVQTQILVFKMEPLERQGNLKLKRVNFECLCKCQATKDLPLEETEISFMDREHRFSTSSGLV